MHRGFTTFATPSRAGGCSAGTPTGRTSTTPSPALSTYLGHAQVSDTYWYLTGIPELLDLAAARFERFAAPEPGDPT